MSGEAGVPLKYLTRVNPRPSTTLNGQTAVYLPMEAIAEFAQVDVERVRPVEELAQGYSYIEDGDVAYAKVTPCFENGKGLVAQGLPGGRAFATTEITVLRPSGGINTRYLAWLLQSSDFKSRATAEMTGAGGLKRVPEAFTLSFRVPLSGVRQQQAIADFLDRETAEIDAFVAESEKLITLLNERRAAVIDAVLARRVGNGVRLKAVLREIDVRAGGDWADEPLLSVSITWGVRRRDEAIGEAPSAEDLSGYKTCLQGDLVLNRMRAFQGALGVADESGLVSPDYAVLRSGPEIESEWLALLMKSSKFVGEMISRLKGIGSTESGTTRTPRINVRDLGNIRVEVPSRTVQVHELKGIQERIFQIDEAIETAREAIALAKERRQALISAAVTGKIDVRSAA